MSDGMDYKSTTVRFRSDLRADTAVHMQFLAEDEGYGQVISRSCRTDIRDSRIAIRAAMAAIAST